MIAAIRPFFGFYSNYLIESLTALRKQGLISPEIWNIRSMLAPLVRTAFQFVSPTGLPGAATVLAYRSEPYHWTESAGPIREIEIAELLVSLAGPDGAAIKNPKYFEAVHAAGLEAEVDKRIVPAAIDYAVENDLIGGNQVIAVNMFQASATPEFFDLVSERLSFHGLGTDQIMLELLEHQTEITNKHIEAVAYGRSLGLNFALDDVDPRDPHDRERVRLFAPFCNIIKIKREVMRDVRNGLYDADQFEADLASLTEGQDVLVLAEGVPRKNHSEMPFSVNATQSMWVDLGAK